jgi:hypothetical protein
MHDTVKPAHVVVGERRGCEGVVLGASCAEVTAVDVER